jgi:Ca2+/Na+ antiporter
MGNQPMCTPQTFIVIFGTNIPVINNRLRVISLVIYSVTTLISVLAVVVWTYYKATGWKSETETSVLPGSTQAIPKRQREALVLSVFSLVVIFVDCLFIADTELMVSRSRRLVGEGESNWTFGQTLAVLVVIVPFWEAGKDIYEWGKERIKAEDDNGTLINVTLHWLFGHFIR